MGFHPGRRAYPVSTNTSNSISNKKGWMVGTNQTYGIGRPHNVNHVVSQKTTPYNYQDGELKDDRNLVVQQNTLSGVGKMRSQFISSSAGIKYVRYYIGDEKLRPRAVFSIEGGNVSTNEPYTLHTFTSDSTLKITIVSGNPTSSIPIEYFIVGGGGGGGGASVFSTGGKGRAAGGGGGGGAIETSSISIFANTYSVVVGSGGAGGAQEGGGAGNSSSIFGIIANGGEGGDGRFMLAGQPTPGNLARAVVGGAGGDGEFSGGAGGGGVAGIGTPEVAWSRGGGGGGSNQSGSGGDFNGNGGDDINNDWDGSIDYGGGGGGGAAAATTTVVAGSGGGTSGAAGAANNASPSDAPDNRGGGGGGAGAKVDAYGNVSVQGSRGGSGIVIIRYLTSYTE